MHILDDQGMFARWTVDLCSMYIRMYSTKKTYVLHCHEIVD